jgi:small nuclear ribonucleoprotein (snRNP)-like protein
MSSTPVVAAATNNYPASSTPTTKAKSSSAESSNLAPLLRHFAGIDIIVETKQGRTFRGRLSEADAYMNLVLDLRRDTTKRGARASSSTILGNTESAEDDDDGGGETTTTTFDWVHIRGPSIRYVIFGASVDVVGVVRAGRDRERSAGDRYRRGVRRAPPK